MIYSMTYNQDLANIEQKSELRKIVSPVKVNTSVKFKESSHYMPCSHQCFIKFTSKLLKCSKAMQCVEPQTNKCQTVA